MGQPKSKKPLANKGTLMTRPPDAQTPTEGLIMRHKYIRSINCCRTLFDAFANEYPKAVLNGRQKLWADAVRATVSMLEEQETPPPTPGGE